MAESKPQSDFGNVSFTRTDCRERSEVAGTRSSRWVSYRAQNGPAATELRRRCGWLHHGCDPIGSTEYKVVTRLNSRPRAGSPRSLLSTSTSMKPHSGQQRGAIKARVASNFRLTWRPSYKGLTALCRGGTIDDAVKSQAMVATVTGRRPGCTVPVSKNLHHQCRRTFSGHPWCKEYRAAGGLRSGGRPPHQASFE